MTHDPRHSQPGQTSPAPSAADLCDALALVLYALDIPEPATPGGTLRRRQVLEDRIRHVVALLREIIDGLPPVAWHLEYVRELVDEHPPIGYRHAGA